MTEEEWLRTGWAFARPKRSRDEEEAMLGKDYVSQLLKVCDNEIALQGQNRMLSPVEE